MGDYPEHNTLHEYIPMKLQEKISHAINTMTMDELFLLYEHIQWLEHIKQMAQTRPVSLPIEKILSMTQSSTDCWAESVNEERRDRV